MRYYKHQKAETCARIVRLASTQIRESGADSLRVADLMHLAGLTHGGFYHHFRSREDLVDHAVEHAISGSVERWRRIADRAQTGQHIGDIVNFYLSAPHSLDIGEGCALPSLSAEIPRTSSAARKAFAAGLSEMIAILTEHMALQAKNARPEAIAMLSLMVGSVLLSRAANDASLADEILSAGKYAVLGDIVKRRSGASRAKMKTNVRRNTKLLPRRSKSR
ncbi:TetR/AcrR family transcriptional regulator [Bradyrhizobium pachyrhizi]|uniref:TetR/AcrR family transcriptional regulator n=1 Tax=Bradyrhizobium pachyrhizi TaxID=280333 RepID=UPI00067E13B8|nr:TetR/AcrR family transcriptional regulator [Bradyrhizobium pachyrhizi]